LIFEKDTDGWIYCTYNDTTWIIIPWDTKSGVFHDSCDESEDELEWQSLDNTYCKSCGEEFPDYVKNQMMLRALE
jgi:hypothetical protein